MDTEEKTIYQLSPYYRISPYYRNCQKVVVFFDTSTKSILFISVKDKVSEALSKS